MFWKKKPKLPITPEDQEWVDHSLEELQVHFGQTHFEGCRTVTPTSDFFERDYRETEADAVYVFQRIKEIMNLTDEGIQVEFLRHEPIELVEGQEISTEEDTPDQEDTRKDGNDPIVRLDSRLINDPFSLIASISHELSGQVLLKKEQVGEEEDFLTDLSVIAHGFGIYLGNSRTHYLTGRYPWGATLPIQRKGYLPEPIIAYTMAKLSSDRRESVEYNKYLNRSMKDLFDQSWEYLRVQEEGE